MSIIQCLKVPKEMSCSLHRSSWVIPLALIRALTLVQNSEASVSILILSDKKSVDFNTFLLDKVSKTVYIKYRKCGTPHFTKRVFGICLVCRVLLHLNVVRHSEALRTRHSKPFLFCGVCSLSMTSAPRSFLTV